MTPNLSELLGRPVECADGRPVGVIRDLWLQRENNDASTPPGSVAYVIITPPGHWNALAYTWGYATGRALAPAPLRWLLLRLAQQPSRIDAAAVATWEPMVVTLATSARIVPLDIETKETS